jgi:hypothetical protein
MHIHILQGYEYIRPPISPVSGQVLWSTKGPMAYILVESKIRVTQMAMANTDLTKPFCDKANTPIRYAVSVRFMQFIRQSLHYRTHRKFDIGKFVTKSNTYIVSG